MSIKPSGCIAILFIVLAITCVGMLVIFSMKSINLSTDIKLIRTINQRHLPQNFIRVFIKTKFQFIREHLQSVEQSYSKTTK